MSTLWFIVAYNYGQCVAVQVLCGLLWLCNEIHLWAMHVIMGIAQCFTSKTLTFSMFYSWYKKCDQCLALASSPG